MYGVTEESRSQGLTIVRSVVIAQNNVNLLSVLVVDEKVGECGTVGYELLLT